MSLDHLKPKSANVIVGEHDLVLRPANIMQQSAFASALAPLLKDVVADLGPLMQGESSVDQVLNSIPGVVEALSQRAPELVGAVAELLDNQQNFKTLVAADVVGAEDAERGSSGYYIQCDALRAYIRHCITVPQIVHVVTEAAVVNDLSSVGKALGKFFQAPPAATMTEAQPSGVPTVERQPTMPETLVEA